MTINMNRMVFGAKFVAEGMESGKLYIQIQDAPLLTLEAPNTEVQDIFTFATVGSPLRYIDDGKYGYAGIIQE